MTRSAPVTRLLIPALCFAIALTRTASADDVSAYLPLNLEPELETRIEQVLILADQPVLKRPIPVATLRAALTRACAVDTDACEYVERHLAALLESAPSIRTSAEGAGTGSTDRSVPNRFGLDGTSPWVYSAQLSWQLNRYALINAGAVAYDGEANPEGSFVSLGVDRAQLDLGYRSHWLSPLTDSSMLIGTEAPTMPAATLSNIAPLTRLRLRYEFFLADMSRSNRIAYRGGFTEGRPRLAGAHLSVEPARGWSIGVNRLLQYGGGARGGQSFRDLLNAFFNPGRFDNANSGVLDDQFGNQLASVTSSFIFPARNPVAIYLEYAGEDTSRGRSYLLGNAALSAGIRMPRLADRIDLSLEFSEWQNGWYVNGLYGDGLTNRGRVIGHWGGAARTPGDEIGAQSVMARLAWTDKRGADVELRYRTLRNESYGRFQYDRAQELSLRYSRPFRDVMTAGATLEAGRDVFGESYARVGGFLRYANGVSQSPLRDRSAVTRAARADGAEWFVDAGLAANRVTIDLADNIPRFMQTSTSPHVAIGARRQVSKHQDLGVRLEFDQVDGHLLTAVRALDYRYRFGGPLAVSAFLGAARYDLATPAYGLWGGAGVAWRDLLPGWDLGLEARIGIKIARDHLVPGDPIGGRPDSFYDIESAALSLSRRF
jgi:hypothetical protein